MNKLNKIAVAIASMTCASAFAQFQSESDTYNPSWYIMPSLNTMKADAKFGSTQSGQGLGLRMGKPLSENWDIQFGPAFARVKNNGQRYEQITLGADGLYLFSRENFRPFVLVGLGAERDKANRLGNETARVSPYISAGLGFQYSFSDQWGTQLDFRRVRGYQRSGAFGFDHNHNNYVTLGLVYTFDKPVRRATVAYEAPAPVFTPAPVMAPPPEPVKVAPAPPTPPPPRFERYTLSATELFAFDSDVLRQPEQPKLDEIAAALNANPAVNNVMVTGYADRIGSATYNQKLSLRRAESTKNYLTSKGVNPARISTAGKGEENPVVECKERNLAALIRCLEPNRRVEVEQITIERRVQ